MLDDLDIKFAEAKFLLGLLHYHGLGVAPDRSRAFSLFLDAAGVGLPNAQYWLARVLQEDQGGVARAEALEWLRKAATQGHVAAAFDLGLLLTSEPTGDAAVRDGLDWLERAAAWGSATAALRLGSLYEDGKVVPADIARVRTWLERAAEMGSPAALAALANAYRSGGFGLPVRPERAMELEHRADSLRRKVDGEEFKRIYDAAVNGSKAACQVLATVYSSGALGVQRDAVKAEFWANRGGASFPAP